MSNAELAAQLRRLKACVGVIAVPLGVLLIFLLARDLKANPEPQVQDTLTVRHLRLVDEKGNPRMVFGMPLGNPIVQGKEYPRSTKVYGLQFLDKAGNETGGVAVAETPIGDVNTMCYDWTTAEALCIVKTPDETGIAFYAKPKPTDKVGVPGPQQLSFHVGNGGAEVTLGDNNGKDRIVLSTDSKNNAEIKILDANGKILFKAPQ